MFFILFLSLRFTLVSFSFSWILILFAFRKDHCASLKERRKVVPLTSNLTLILSNSVCYITQLWKKHQVIEFFAWILQFLGLKLLLWEEWSIQQDQISTSMEQMVTVSSFWFLKTTSVVVKRFINPQGFVDTCYSYAAGAYGSNATQEIEYKEPWVGTTVTESYMISNSYSWRSKCLIGSWILSQDYYSYYPITLPQRRPYAGDPGI